MGVSFVKAWEREDNHGKTCIKLYLDYSFVSLWNKSLNLQEKKSKFIALTALGKSIAAGLKNRKKFPSLEKG